MNKTILVIEDDIALQKAINKKLKRSGFNVFTSRDVQHSLKLVMDRNIQVDAVWLDHYLLGQENGLDFVAKMKNDKKLKHIPIFVVSNTASHDKISTYIKFGISNYYTKSDNKLENIIADIRKNLK